MRGNGDATWLWIDHHAACSGWITTVVAISTVVAIIAIIVIVSFGVVGGGQDQSEPVMDDRIEGGNHFDVLNGDAESVFVLLG